MSAYTLRHLVIPASDGLLLPSLYYAGARLSSRLAIFVHGAGSSSIIRNPLLTNSFAEALYARGIDFLAFNNRGAGYITKFDRTDGSNYLGGMAYERIAGFSADIKGLVKWAEAQGYKNIYLIGHSTGANKIAYDLSRHTYSSLGAAVLIGGGDDIALQRSLYKIDELGQIEKTVKGSVQAGLGDELVSDGIFRGNHPISWGSFHELITPGSDYDVFPFERSTTKPLNRDFEDLRQIELPLLFMYGSDDFGTIIPPQDAVGVLRKNAPNGASHIILNADHSLHGKETEFAAYIAGWLADK